MTRKQSPRARRSARSRVDRVACVLLGTLLVLPQGMAPAATIEVSGACRLPSAIAAANANAPRGGCPAGLGADTLELSANVTLTTADNPDNGLPVITSNVTIEGGGFSIKRVGNAPPFRILDVAGSGKLTLENVRITNGDVAGNGAGIRSLGRLVLRNTTITGNSSGNRGGGIYARDGELTLVDSRVTRNTAKRGGGIAAYNVSEFYDEFSILIGNSSISRNVASARGGGLLLNASHAALSNTTISANSAASGGGIRADEYSIVTIEGGAMSNNSADLEGGGARSATGSTLRLSATRVTNNRSSRGGGIFVAGSYDLAARTSFDYSTVSGNRAIESGGGLFVSGWEGYWSLTNSTVSGNTATTGGGIHLEPAYYRLDGAITASTVVGNSATTGGGIFGANFEASYHVLNDSIVAGNTGGNCVGTSLYGFAANFDDDGTCPEANALTVGLDIDPELADNGGPTPTHALLPGSAAVDAVGPCFLSLDQRRFRREGLCDAGAFELDAVEPVGAEVVGVVNRKVLCKNRTTGEKRTRRTGDASWQCADLGVPVASGDRVLMTSTGTADGSGPVGGSVGGLATPPKRRVTCRNKTAKRKVSFVLEARSWNCESEGLEVSTGDVIQQKIKGGA